MRQLWWFIIKKMHYSVIIPTFNRLELLKRAINSVYMQTLPAEKIIVVDDGSTDDTYQYISLHYPEVILIKQKNKGVSAARNRGFAEVSTQWVSLLDSDDEWLPQKMEKQLLELEKTQLKVCHSEEIWIRNGVRVNAKNKHQKKSGDIFFDCLKLCAMSPSAIVMDSSVWKEFDGFDESFIVCEDYDLWLRIAEKYPVALVEQAQIRKYGGHDDQLSRQYYGMDKFRIMAMQKMLSVELPEEKSLALRNMIKKKLIILMKGAIKHQNQELIAFCDQREYLLNLSS